MRQIYLYINLIILSLYVSCKKIDKSIYSKLETINLEEGINKKVTLKLSQIVSKIEYIPLETKEDCFISDIEDLFICNDKLIVFDYRSQSVLVFNNQGRFLWRIGKKGNGPGENPFIDYVSVNDYNSTIVIKSSYYNFYKIDGSFIKAQYDLPRVMQKIAFLNENIVLSYSRPIYVYNQNYQIAIFNSNYQMFDRFINRSYEGMTTEKSMNIYSNSLNRLQFYNDTLSYWEYKYDTIYRIPDKKTCYPRYAFKYSRKQYLDASFASLKANGTQVVEKLIETKNYIFLQLYDPSSKDTDNEMVYFKNEKQVIKLKFEENIRGIINDIDGGIEVLPRKVLKDGRVYCTFSAFELKELLNEEPYKSIKPIYPEKHKQLLELVNRSKMEDNPVIMLLTLK